VSAFGLLHAIENGFCRTLLDCPALSAVSLAEAASEAGATAVVVVTALGKLAVYLPVLLAWAWAVSVYEDS
jgi:hypothetical protein